MLSVQTVKLSAMQYAGQSAWERNELYLFRSYCMNIKLFLTGTNDAVSLSMWWCDSLSVHTKMQNLNCGTLIDNIKMLLLTSKFLTRVFCRRTPTKKDLSQPYMQNVRCRTYKNTGQPFWTVSGKLQSTELFLFDAECRTSRVN